MTVRRGWLAGFVQLGAVLSACWAVHWSFPLSRGGDSSNAAVVMSAPPHLAARPLSAEILLEFERSGHVVTRRLLLPDEFARVSTALRSIAEAERSSAEAHAEEFAGAVFPGWEDVVVVGAEEASEFLSEGGEGLSQAPPFLQTFNPHRRHRVARELALAPVLAATAAALLGVACVRLYQDCLFWKRHGDDATAWHADLWTVPLATNSSVTVWVPLQRVGIDDSPLFFQSRSHRNVSALVHAGQLEELGLDGEDCKGPPGIFGEHHAPLHEGDATWHHGWTVHGAPALSIGGAPGGRLAYAATYFADGASVLLSAAEPEDGPSYMDWLPQVEPGSPAAHPLLPVAFP